MAGKFSHLLPQYTETELVSEEWKIVVCDGIKYFDYAISNLGRVKRTSGRPLKLLWCHAARGEASVYWRVNISRKFRGKRKRRAVLVHRLVAEAFLSGRTKRKRFVHHKDHDTTNPRASNLEWVTQGKNLREYYVWKAEQEALERMGATGDGASMELPEVEQIDIFEPPF